MEAGATNMGEVHSLFFTIRVFGYVCVFLWYLLGQKCKDLYV